MVARYQWHGEDFATDLVSAFTAAIAGGIGTYLATKQKPQYAVLFNGIIGVGGLIGKNYVGSPMAHEMLESLGYGGFYGLGAWVGAVLGKQASVPVWQPGQKAASVIAAPPVVSFQPVSPPPVARPVGSSASILEI